MNQSRLEGEGILAPCRDSREYGLWFPARAKVVKLVYSFFLSGYSRGNIQDFYPRSGAPLAERAGKPQMPSAARPFVPDRDSRCRTGAGAVRLDHGLCRPGPCFPKSLCARLARPVVSIAGKTEYAWMPGRATNLPLKSKRALGLPPASSGCMDWAPMARILKSSFPNCGCRHSLCCALCFRTRPTDR